MATPLGHSLAGAVVYLAFTRGQGIDRPRLAAFIVAASLPDFDFIPGLLLGRVNDIHHGLTHTVAFALLCAALVATWAGVRRWQRPLLAGTLAFLLVGSHLLIDWLTFDPTPPQGLPLLWPYSAERFMAPVSVFLEVRRHDLFTWSTIRHDLLAVLREFLILAPLVWVARAATKRRSAGLPR